MQNEVSGTVHGHAVQARDIFGDVHVHGGEPEYPPLTSWQDRPELTPELSDLLKVQHDTAVTLPYHLLLKKQPTLVDVYVQGSVLPQHTEEPEPEAKDDRERRREPKPVEREPEHAERIMPIKEVLATGRHILITGGPGSGKSTLGQMYVQLLAGEWLGLAPSNTPPLPEPVMPLRISAKALADDLTWSELLAKAARHRTLNAPPRPELFARRALGARWLVFVDGLDEIVDPEHLRQVLDVLTARMRHGTDQQLVITSRDLRSGALDQLQGPHIHRYRIQPFGTDQLEDFAVAWFRIQDPAQVRTRADDFLRQVRDGRLRELVSVPLLATIAAIANTLEPERELPHNRVDLFDRFLTYLLDDKISRRTTIAELRRTIDDTARLEVVEWIYEHRIELIEHLAVQRLESEQPLLEIAAEEIGRPCPPEDLEAVLTSIGVFAQSGQGLDFLHRLFAEFLAARKYAPDIPADFPMLDDWVERGTHQAKETFVLFTFVLWSQRDGNDIGLVIERLLDGSRDHVLLAAKLLAENVRVSDDIAANLMDRLAQLVLTLGADRDPWDDVHDVSRVLGGLSGTSIVGELMSRLRQLQHNVELALATRSCCAIALGRLGADKESARWLVEEFDSSFDPNAQRAIARGLAEILPDGASRVEQLALRHAHDESDYEGTIAVVQILVDLKRREAAAALVRRMVRHMRDNAEIKPGSSNIPRTRDNLEGGGPPPWRDLMRLAADLRCTDEALWTAGLMLAESSPSSSFGFREAAAMVLSLGDKSAVNALIEQTQQKPTDLKLDMAILLGTTHPEVAEQLAREVMAAPDASANARASACQVLVEIAPEAAATLADDLTGVDAADLADLAVNLAAAGVASEHLMRRALAGPFTASWKYEQTARLALDLDGFGQEVHAVAIAGLPDRWATTAPLLHQAGYHELSSHLVDRLITGPAEPTELSSCLADFATPAIPDLAMPLLEKLMTLVDVSDTEVARQLVPMLHRIDRTTEAVAIAEQALLRELSNGGIFVEECAEVLLDVAGSKSADSISERVIGQVTSAERRLAVARKFQQRGLLRHAAAMWLDVLRTHGSVVSTGVETADQLVRCGYRQQATETVRTAVNDDRLPATQRTYLRALLAWLEAMAPE